MRLFAITYKNQTSPADPLNPKKNKKKDREFALAYKLKATRTNRRRIQHFAHVSNFGVRARKFFADQRVLDDISEAWTVRVRPFLDFAIVESDTDCGRFSGIRILACSKISSELEY